MTDETTVREQPVARENIVISPSKRGGALIHIYRGERKLGPAASDEIVFINRTMPDIAAFASGDVGAALAALEQARKAYEEGSAALARERAELEQRASKLRGVETRARALAADLSATG